MSQKENSDPINPEGVAHDQPVIQQPVAVPALNGNLPPLQNQNQSFVVHDPTIIEGLFVPEVGQFVYVKNEPGQQPYVYKAEVTEYPFLINGSPRFEFVKVRVLEYVQPVVPSGSQRQRVNREFMVSRRYISDERKATAQEYAPINEESYQKYLDKLNEENPAGGRRPNKKSSKKRKSSTKRKLRHKSKSHKRRRA